MYAKVSVLAVFCLSIWATAHGEINVEEEKEAWMITMFGCANKTGYNMGLGEDGDPKNKDMCENEVTQKFTDCVTDGVGGMDDEGNLNKKFWEDRCVGEKVEEKINECHVEVASQPREMRACTAMNFFQRQNKKDIQLMIDDDD